MKKVILAYVAGMVMFAVGADSQEWITMTGEKWPPYNSRVLDPQRPGFMFEIVQAIFEENGYRFKYTERPWARAIEDTRRGAFNALIGPGKGDAPDFVFPEEEIGFTRNVFYVRRDFNWEFNGLESLSRIRLGILKSMTYGDLMDDYIRRNRRNKQRIDIISGEDYLARNFTKLKMGRIDATIDDGMVISSFLQRTGQKDQFRNAGSIGEGYGIYIAFSPKYPHAQKLASIITAGVWKLRQNGELNRIMLKYGAHDWKKQK